jgi:Skp family chaperone for outer membrane proteins
MSMTDFDDLTNRILDKMDEMEKKIDNLCNRMTKVEINLDNHFRELDQKKEANEKKFYYIIAIMGVSFTIYEVVKGLL